MILKFGEKLREMRKRKGITQEELSESLGVTYQAVSRWERSEGYPDINMLPELARFFNTSIDELLCFNEKENQHKIKKYLQRGAEFYNKQDYKNCVTTLSDALLEFPSSYELMNALIRVLYSSYNVIKKRNHEEIILLGKRILDYCTDDKICEETKVILCYHYLYNLKNKDKAREIADTVPKFSYGRTFIHALCLDDDENKQKTFQCMIMDSAHVTAGAIRCYLNNNNELTISEKIELYIKCNKMYEVLFDNEYDYDILFSNNLTTAIFFMELNQHENAVKKLTCCWDYAKKFDELNKISKAIKYQTPLLNKVFKHNEPQDAFERQETHNISLCAVFLNEMENHRKIFKPLLDNDAYKELIKISRLPPL